MNAYKLGDGLRRPAAETTFGSDAEICYDLLRGRNAFACSLGSIGKMHQPQVEFRPGLKLEVAQRRKIGHISAIARHRHMYPIDVPLDTCGDRVGNLNQVRGVLRLLKVLVSKVAITEVIA